MMQTSLSERVDYLLRVIAAAREKQRSNYALKNHAKGNHALSRNSLELMQSVCGTQARELGRVIREAERDILRLKAAN